MAARLSVAAPFDYSLERDHTGRHEEEFPRI